MKLKFPKLGFGTISLLMALAVVAFSLIVIHTQSCN